MWAPSTSVVLITDETVPRALARSAPPLCTTDASRTSSEMHVLTAPDVRALGSGARVPKPRSFAERPHAARRSAERSGRRTRRPPRPAQPKDQ
eukprot:5244293-Pleurochrysis_carterae.AAC.2